MIKAEQTRIPGTPSSSNQIPLNLVECEVSIAGNNLLIYQLIALIMLRLKILLSQTRMEGIICRSVFIQTAVSPDNRGGTLSMN